MPSADLSVLSFVTSGSYDVDDLDVDGSGFFSRAIYRSTGDGSATFISRKTDGPNPNETIDADEVGLSRRRQHELLPHGRAALAARGVR